MVKKLYWVREKETLWGQPYPIFHIYQNKPNEWILRYLRTPKTKVREFVCKSEQQAKIIANKLVKS